MKLFLTSYLAGTKKLVEEFLSELEPKVITFIPTAANVEEYRGYVGEAMTAFQEMGFQLRILDVEKYEKNYLVESLKECKCLYVSGGNTFYLLQEFKRKGLCEIIKERVLEGMMYIGESAGAIIASKDIEYSQIMDDKNVAKELVDYSALRLFEHFILPHNGEFPFVESTAQTIEKYKDSLSLLPINNSQAVIVRENKYEVIEG